MMKRRRFKQLVAGAAIALAFGSAHAQQTIRLTAATGHPTVFLWVKTLDEVFLPEVDRRLAAAGGKHRIEWTRAWGGTLLKLGSESKGFSDGVADLGLVLTVFEAPKFPLHNVSYFTPFGTEDIALVDRTVADLQRRIPAMNDVWTRNNLVYLGGLALENYQIFTKFPLTRLEDLQGKKISAPGPAANWIKGTGAIAVSGNLNTYYEDLKSGVSDGVIVFGGAAASAKLFEVAPHLTRVNFGAMFAGGIAVNRNRFEKLPPEVQTAMREAAQVFSASYAKAQNEATEAALKRMVDAGLKVADFPEAERKRWADALPPVAKTWADELEGKGQPARQVLSGYMESLVKAGARIPRDWSK